MVLARMRATLGQVQLPVWRILLHSSVLGLALSIADLLFNFYLVSLGYTAETVGLFSTVSRVAGMVLGIPLGLLIDRIGAQRAMFVGLATYSLGWFLILQFTTLWVMLPIQLLIGASYILCASAITPLLAGVTYDHQRATVFGWNATATLAVGLLGSAVGGILPSIAADALQVGPKDTAAYRVALMVVIALGLLAMLPIIGRISMVQSKAEHEVRTTPDVQLSFWTLLRFSASSLLLGLGGGAILPFQNLFFRQVFGMEDAAVGVVLAWTALGMGLGGLVGAPFAARFGLRRAGIWLRLGSVPAMFLMLIPSFIPAFIGFLLRGFFVAASYPLNDALVVRATPLQQRGIAMSMLSVTWAGGWALSAWLSGVVQVTWGFVPVLIFSAVIYAFSAWAIVLLPAQEAAATSPSEA